MSNNALVYIKNQGIEWQMQTRDRLAITKDGNPLHYTWHRVLTLLIIEHNQRTCEFLERLGTVLATEEESAAANMIDDPFICREDNENGDG